MSSEKLPAKLHFLTHNTASFTNVLEGNSVKLTTEVSLQAPGLPQEVARE
jgi:hypothetical protein